MKTSRKIKNLGKTLYQQGESTHEIAERCQVSVRTAQRWVKEFEKNQQTNTVHQSETREFQTEISDTAVVAPLPTLAKITNSASDETLNLNLTSQMALKLLTLTDTAISTLEACLLDPEGRYLDKLKAIQILGTWVGLEEKYPVVVNRIFRAFDLNIENVDVDTATVVPTPNKLQKAQKAQKAEQEKPEKLADQLANPAFQQMINKIMFSS